MKKYIPLIFATLTFIFVFMASYNVYLFGDDYYYVTYTQGTIQDFWAHHLEHYTIINGRAIVHLLASIFLSTNLIWWKLFNSFMLASIVYFGSKITSKNTLISGLTFFLGICSIGIDVSRQSIYWVTGSFNYIYPIFMLFIYWYFLLKYRETKKHAILMCLLAFIAASTVEQGAMMVLGLTVLLGIRDFIVYKKLDKKYIAIIIASLLGAMSVILSPATFVRFELENQEELSFISKLISLILYLLNSYFFTKWMLPLNLAFVLLGFAKSKNKLIKALLLLDIPILLYGVYSISTSSVIDLSKIFVTLYMLLAYAIIVIDIVIKEFKEIKTSSMTFTIATILLIGSQIMIVVSSVYGNRNLLFGIFMLILMIAYLTDEIELVELNLKTCIITAILLVLSYISISNQIAIIEGYRESHKIELENIEKINNNTSNKLVLKMPNIDYTWSMPYVSEYHKHYYKMYYHLENVDVTWK